MCRLTTSTGAPTRIRDVACEAGIGEQAERMGGVQFDEDIGIAVWTSVAARDRPEDGNVPHATLVQLGFVGL